MKFQMKEHNSFVADMLSHPLSKDKSDQRGNYPPVKITCLMKILEVCSLLLQKWLQR